MVQQVSRPASGQNGENPECRHHWIIESPTGPVSQGICRRCDAVKEFKNYIETAPWGEESSSQTSSKLANAAIATDPPEEQEEA